MVDVQAPGAAVAMGKGAAAAAVQTRPAAPTVAAPARVQDDAQVRPRPDHPTDPVGVKFGDADGPTLESLLKKTTGFLADKWQQGKDKIEGYLRDLGEAELKLVTDCKHIATLLSKPDLTAEDVRNAAASLQRFRRRLADLPGSAGLAERLARLAGDLDRLADGLDAVQKHLKASDLQAAREDLVRIKSSLEAIKDQLPAGGERLDERIKQIDPLIADLDRLDGDRQAILTCLQADPPDTDAASDHVKQLKATLKQVKGRVPALVGECEAKAIGGKIDGATGSLDLFQRFILDPLASNLKAVQGHLEASPPDLKAAQDDLKRIQDTLDLLKGQVPRLVGGDQEKIKETTGKIDKAIQDIEAKKQQIEKGRKITTRLDQTRDGDILDFLKQASNEDRKLLLYFASEKQFARIFANASYSIIFELYGSDNLARDVVAAAGKDLGRLQPYKLGIMAAHLCHGGTSEEDEKALIAIVKQLDNRRLADFGRGLKDEKVDFAQLVDEIADHGTARQETLEALAALHKAAAADRAARVEVQKVVARLPLQERRNFEKLAR